MSTTQASSQGIEYRTLPELIDHGSQALVRGDFSQAAQAFNAIRENYAEEPIWQDGQLPAKILPLAGFASHKANLQTEAILALESYLASYAQEQDSEIFARYTLASSLLLDGQQAKAREAFTALKKRAGRSPFRDLASLREAQLSAAPRAVEILQEVIRTPNSPRLATFARLRLIQLHLEQEDVEEARIQLLDTPWPDASMPELATLTFLATQVADTLIGKSPSDALRAYQLVSPKKLLEKAQANRIAELQERYHNLAPALRTEQSMWSDQFRQSLQQLRSQLQSLRDSPDYGPAIDLRKARCFARLNRPLEAWILLQPIANSEHNLAREAHLEWISTARSLHAWNPAAEIAQTFLKKYPEDDDVPQILLWIALAQIEQENYSEASQSLRSLIDKNPPHAIDAAAKYYLGFSYYTLNNTTAAIAAFEKCRTASPNSPVAKQAHLWVGICHFTTNNIEKAIASFTAIQEDPEAHFLHPEASFREAACYYAMGKLEQSLTLAESWLASYSLHARAAEVHFLRGDILSEQHLLAAAIDAYSQVETDDSQLRFLALEKRGHLLLELHRKEQALALLDTFRKEQTLDPAHIGRFTQLLADCLSHERAQAEIANAISFYGNDPNAEGIIELLHRLESTPNIPETKPTLASRLLVAAIQNHRALAQTTQAKLKALQLASRFDKDALPPCALVEAGNALTEISSLEGPDYFHRVLKSYPNSHYTSDGYLGLARYHAQRGFPSDAFAYLLQATQHDMDALSLKLELESKLEQHLNARTTAEAMLSQPQATPSHKAQALHALGEIALRNGENENAYAYFQRIFTLYRGEADKVATAYLNCIQILDSEERDIEAQKVASDFLAQTDLQHQPEYHQAQRWVELFSRNSAPAPAGTKR